MKIVKKIIYKLFWSMIIFLTWGILITTVLISISGISALLSYLHWEYLLTGIHGIVAFLGITSGSLGLGFLFSFKFICLIEDILEDSKLFKKS